MRKLKLKELNRAEIDEFREMDKFPVVLVLDNIRSAMNVGSFFRTADGFALEKIFLCGISACPPHREINKTAIGADNSVTWQYEDDIYRCIFDLKGKGYKIAGVEQTDASIILNDFVPDPQEKYAFIFGNEVEGLSDNILELLDYAIEIPQFGTKHSFNVSVACGIVLWDYVSKISAAR